MHEILSAFGRTLRSLREPGMLWHMLWPALASALLWTVVALFVWEPLAQGFAAWIASSSFGGWLMGFGVFAAILPALIGLLMLLALLLLIYVTAVVLVSAFAVSMMLERVARREYGTLEQRHGGTALGSAWNAVAAGAIFVVLLVVSLPFWLIPGVAMVVPLLLTAWMNRRTFGYDALMLHADREELQRLPGAWRGSMFLLGGICALLVFIPVVNLFAPAFTGVAFIHFMLGRLGREREARQAATARNLV